MVSGLYIFDNQLHRGERRTVHAFLMERWLWWQPAGQSSQTCFFKLGHHLSFGYHTDQKRWRTHGGTWRCKCWFAM